MRPYRRPYTSIKLAMDLRTVHQNMSHLVIRRIQDTTGGKVDVDRWKMDIFALVLCSNGSFDGTKFNFGERHVVRTHNGKMGMISLS